MHPYRSSIDSIDLARTMGDARWTTVVRAAARITFAAIVLLTAMGIGALFVAWPTQTETRSSMHMSVGSRVTETASVQYVVEASP